MKNYLKILPILFLSLFIISCDDDNDDDGVCCAGSSIVDLASQTESLSTLVSALQVTGLDELRVASKPVNCKAETKVLKLSV